jgi:hypothetical protein
MALYRRKDAGIWYADFYVDGQRGRGEYARPVKVTLSEFGQRCIEYAKTNKRSWRRDEQIMVHLNAALGPTLLADIGPYPIERYKIERVKVASPATVNPEIALLKHMFNLAELWAIYRGRNPMKGIKSLSGQCAIPIGERSRGSDVAPALLAVSGSRHICGQHRIPARRNSEFKMGGDGCRE